MAAHARCSAGPDRSAGHARRVLAAGRPEVWNWPDNIVRVSLTHAVAVPHRRAGHKEDTEDTVERTASGDRKFRPDIQGSADRRDPGRALPLRRTRCGRRLRRRRCLLRHLRVSDHPPADVRTSTQPARISLSGFYARRIKRLLPSALTVILVTEVAARLWGPPLQAVATAKDSIFSTFYVMNYRLAAKVSTTRTPAGRCRRCSISGRWRWKNSSTSSGRWPSSRSESCSDGGWGRLCDSSSARRSRPPS